MRTLDRKKDNSFKTLLLFVLSSILVHGLLLIIFAKSRRSLPIVKPKTNQTPIDFVVVPPDETIKEPPPETKKIATDNSVAEGKVNPDLPVASNKLGEAPIAVKPIAPKAPPKPESKPVNPPQPQAVKPPIKPEVVKPEPPQKPELVKPEPVKPVLVFEEAQV